MALIFRYFWIVGILIMFANAAAWWVRGRPYREANPELEVGYRSLIRGFLIWANIPWFWMGLSILIGKVPSALHYLYPQEGGIFVHVWYGIAVFYWIIGTDWIFRRNGADALARHPGWFNVPVPDVVVIRACWILLVLSGIVGMAMTYLMDIPMKQAIEVIHAYD